MKNGDGLSGKLLTQESTFKQVMASFRLVLIKLDPLSSKQGVKAQM